MLTSLALLLSQPQAAGPLDWLVGTWCTAPDNGAYMCESWAPMDGGVMRGEARRVKDGGVTIGETMRIRSGKSGMFLHAEPKGQSPADFRAVRIDPKLQAVTFENRTHDYPQRIRYWIEQGRLMAEISMADGGKPRRWAYRRRGADLNISLD
ncbi:DUF6265 family protein [Sphingomonas sp. MMS12-HWE2-04]|uniref:DUF6265 family protein n=1 Tax=Sphingomonas sp. MMS12-HWE2-04 TaxID=3234199 RepID=UPI00384F1A78